MSDTMPPNSRATDAALSRALALVRDLRARCPWDHAQTRETLRPYLVEEALELDQALKGGEPVELRDELGDLLLHLAFQIVIGEERRELDAETVTRALEEKMWRRHPKLFGDSEAPDHEGWERVKKRERGAGSGTLRGLPPSLPPLLMAFRLQERAAGVGFDWPDATEPMDKVKEEIVELAVVLRDAADASDRRHYAESGRRLHYRVLLGWAQMPAAGVFRELLRMDAAEALVERGVAPPGGPGCAASRGGETIVV